MPDIQLIRTNMRKIIIATVSAVVIFVLLFLDNATIGVFGRAISNNLEVLGLRSISGNNFMSLVTVPSTIITQTLGAVRISSIIICLLSVIVVVSPIYMLLVRDMTVANVESADNSYREDGIQIVQCNRQTYILQDKFRC